MPSLRNIATLFYLVISTMLIPNAQSFAAAPVAPLYDRDFNAESTLSDRGRTIWWRYHASSMVHITKHFGTVNTMEVTVADTVVLRQYWLNLDTGELVIEITLPNASESQVTHLSSGSGEYHDGIDSMITALTTMIDLDARNAALASAVEYLKSLKN